MRAKIFTLHVLLLLAGCSSIPSLPYKIDIQQGNVVTHEMMEKLKSGMTRAQVRFVLGSPMISDAFHGNRWDYVYRLEQAGRLIEQQRITVFFEDDRMTHTEGQLRPSLAVAPPKAAVIATPVIAAPVIEQKRALAASPQPVAPGSGQIPPQPQLQPQPEVAGAKKVEPVVEKKYDTAALPQPAVPSATQPSASSSAVDSLKLAMTATLSSVTQTFASPNVAGSEKMEAVIEEGYDAAASLQPAVPGSAQPSSSAVDSLKLAIIPIFLSPTLQSFPSGGADFMEADQPKGERDLFGERGASRPKEKKGLLDRVLGK